MKNFRKNQGITLIALVITVIVLLILAGVTIVALTGDNGILTRAQEAKEETENASDRDKIAMAVLEAQIGENGYQELNSNNLQEAIDNQFNGRNAVVADNGDRTFTVSCLDTLKDYTILENGVEDGIDWNRAMANAVAPESQDEGRNEGVIGIGTDGKPVDMDLWEYTLMDEGTYVLNDEQYYSSNISDAEISTRSSGYRDENVENGKIKGEIPVYISQDNGNSYKPVTSLRDTFSGLKNLEEMPNIPNTVISMRCSFQSCSNLTEISNIPNSVKEMIYTFNGAGIIQIPNLPYSLEILRGAFNSCTNLIKANEDIPKNVIDISNIFSNCTNLEEVGNINSEKLEKMEQAYYLCRKLKKGPEIIPQTVTAMRQAFQECNALNGLLKVYCDPQTYNLAFWNVASNENCNLNVIVKDENIKEKLYSTSQFSNANINYVIE